MNPCARCGLVRVSMIERWGRTFCDELCARAWEGDSPLTTAIVAIVLAGIALFGVLRYASLS